MMMMMILYILPFLHQKIKPPPSYNRQQKKPSIIDYYSQCVEIKKKTLSMTKNCSISFSLHVCKWMREKNHNFTLTMIMMIGKLIFRSYVRYVYVFFCSKPQNYYHFFWQMMMIEWRRRRRLRQKTSGIFSFYI